MMKINCDHNQFVTVTPFVHIYLKDTENEVMNLSPCYWIKYTMSKKELSLLWFLKELDWESQVRDAREILKTRSLVL